MKKLILLAVAATFASVTFGGIRAITPAAREADSWLMKRHNELLQVASNTTAKVVFLGDDLTHFWFTNGKRQWLKYFDDGELKALNLGVAKDRTEHVLWRIGEGGELDGYEAKCVVLMIGTNNAGDFDRTQEPVGDTVLGVREILKTIREKQPKAKIVLCAILPRGADFTDPVRQRNDLVNRAIAGLADGKDIFWCDFREQFLTPDGRLPLSICRDLVHPSEYGYEIWANAVIPYLQAAVCDQPMPPSRYAPFCRPEHFGVGSELATFPTALIGVDVRNGKDWWADRFLRNRKEAADSNGEIDLVFAGDSITHNWESKGKESLAELRKTYTILDMGYSGDRTDNLLWRCENGELDGYKAKCIMMMIGTNNSWHRQDDPQHIAAGIRRILDVMREKQPQAKIVLLRIFPFGEGEKNAIRINNEKVNAIIKDYADGKNIFWLDFASELVDEKGDMIKSANDRCHPRDEVYRDIWMKHALPLFRQIVGK